MLTAFSTIGGNLISSSETDIRKINIAVPRTPPKGDKRNRVVLRQLDLRIHHHPRLSYIVIRLLQLPRLGIHLRPYHHNLQRRESISDFVYDARLWFS